MGHYFKNVKRGDSSSEARYTVNLFSDNTISWGGGRLPEEVMADKNPGIYTYDTLGVHWYDYDQELTVPNSCTTVDEAYNFLKTAVTNIIETQEGHNFSDYPFGFTDIDTYKNKIIYRIGNKMKISYQRYDTYADGTYIVFYPMNLTNDQIEDVQKAYLIDKLLGDSEFINPGNFTIAQLKEKAESVISGYVDQYAIQKLTLDQTYTVPDDNIFMGDAKA